MVDFPTGQVSKCGWTRSLQLSTHPRRTLALRSGRERSKIGTPTRAQFFRTPWVQGLARGATRDECCFELLGGALADECLLALRPAGKSPLDVITDQLWSLVA
jgi:hypothetical protein